MIEKVKRVFKLIRGSHTEGEVTNPATGSLTPVIYKKGDVFESECDLEKHNSPGAKKFELLFNGTMEKYRALRGTQNSTSAKTNSIPANTVTQDYDRDTLRVMTVKELKQLAESNEIHLGDAHLKDDIINVILGEAPAETGDGE